MTFLQQTLFPPDSPWTPPTGAELPRSWNEVKRIGLDTETCDPDLSKLGIGVRRGGFLAGISFAMNKERGHYLPLRHLGGDNVTDPKLALGYVKKQAKEFTGEVVGARLSYDLDYLAEVGIVFPQATFRDVSVLEPLIDELQYSYGLDNILARHGLPGKDETLLREAAAQFRVDPKKELWKLPARFVGPYAEADATRPLALLEKQEVQVELQQLHQVWDLECKVLPVLLKMRRRGVAIDLDNLDRMDRWSRAEELKAWGELQRITGVAVRVGDAMKAEVIAHALRAVDIEPPRTAGGKAGPKASITKDWLEALDHPAGLIVRRARKFSQLRTTFINSIREHEVRGRIHCTFNQIVRQKDDNDTETEGAAYGRLSCVDPNLQQQPSPDRDPEIAKPWRRTYKPEPGMLWGQLDFSQQEPRGALHFAVSSGPERIGLEAHRSALEAARRFNEDPSTDSHTMFTMMVYGDDVVNEDPKAFKLKRARCKNIFLGICYGMGGPKLCRQLGFPTRIIEDRRDGRRREVAGDEGQALIDLVDRRVPYIRKTADVLKNLAKTRGWVRTLGGRVCHFPVDGAGNFDYTHKAFNRLIQGSAADQVKLAMVLLDAEGAYLQLQVHDEFDLSVESRAEGERYARIMEQCVPMHVPSKVDLEVGPTWGDLAE